MRHIVNSAIKISKESIKLSVSSITFRPLWINKCCDGQCNKPFLVIICYIFYMDKWLQKLGSMPDRICSLAFDVISRVLETGPVRVYTKQLKTLILDHITLYVWYWWPSALLFAGVETCFTTLFFTSRFRNFSSISIEWEGYFPVPFLLNRYPVCFFCSNYFMYIGYSWVGGGYWWVHAKESSFWTCKYQIREY